MLSLKLLLVLFAVVSNKLNQESTAKRRKKGPIKKKQGIAQRSQQGKVDVHLPCPGLLARVGNRLWARVTASRQHTLVARVFVAQFCFLF